MRKHAIEVRIRYAEVDRMGVLHHSRYFVLFEMARTEMLRASGASYRDLEDAGALFVVVRAEARFREPARYDDVVRIEAEITRTGAARIDHAYTMTRDDGKTLLCEGSTTLTCVNRRGEIIPIPEQIAELFRG
jgi:acyl-CoA thioester hydrolase